MPVPGRWFTCSVSVRPAYGRLWAAKCASYPFWSSDNKNLAFFANGKLRKVSVADGAIQALASIGSAPRNGTWGGNGVIIYAPDVGGPLWLDRSIARPLDLS